MYVMLTRISHEGIGSPQSLEDLERELMGRIRSECPDVQWKQSLAVLGPYNYIDIFEAPDNDTATKVSTLVRTYGKADAEVWPATEWHAFKNILHSMPHAEQPTEARPH